MAAHDELNPYTAVQRSASQHFVYVRDAMPLDNAVSLTLSRDAMNLNTIPLSAESAVSLQSRYVVPEVIRPVYGSSSDVDTRSAGNPYSHHPNFTTPSQYFNHLDFETTAPKESQNGEDVLTIMDIKNLADPFNAYLNFGSGAPQVQINPPNDVTVNKNAFASQSLADLQNLQVEFPAKGAPQEPSHLHFPRAHETLNKKMFSPESMYELQQTDGGFEVKDQEGVSNLLVIREFSPSSLADLRDLRNISQYTNFNSGSSKDVATCIGMSPSPYERQQFEYTENVAYGGY